MPAVEDDLKSERDGRRELEGEMEAVRDGLKKMDSEKASSAKEVEEIMGALQGQVDMANKVCKYVIKYVMFCACALAYLRKNLLMCHGQSYA